MSRILHELPASKIGSDPIYPWAEWADGSVHEIARGEDFEIAATSMVSILRVTAKRKEMPITVRKRGDVIAFQFGVKP